MAEQAAQPVPREGSGTAREQRKWRTVYAAVIAFAVVTILALEAFSRHFSG